jgi:preprotein translocase subunit SecG
MYGFLLTIHILVSVFLVIAILLQSGKGSDIGAVFGGAGSQALFGSAGPADFLNKATRVLVVIFMITSLTLGYFTFERPSKSVMATKAAPVVPKAPSQMPAPLAPATPPKAPRPSQ